MTKWEAGVYSSTFVETLTDLIVPLRHFNLVPSTDMDFILPEEATATISANRSDGIWARREIDCCVLK